MREFHPAPTHDERETEESQEETIANPLLCTESMFQQYSRPPFAGLVLMVRVCNQKESASLFPT
jgi:hypothetical protein